MKMTQKITPRLTWEEKEDGTLIGTARIDEKTTVEYQCKNISEDDEPDWKHIRVISSLDDHPHASCECELESSERIYTRTYSIYLCMKDLRELVKTL